MATQKRKGTILPTGDGMSDKGSLKRGHGRLEEIKGE
jgi:hypothetical protein